MRAVDGRRPAHRHGRRRHPLVAWSRLTLPLSARSSAGESSTRLIGPLRNASISGDDQARLLERHVRAVERHHRLERRHRHGAIAQAERRAGRGPRNRPSRQAPCSAGLGFDARNLHAPVADRVLVLHIEPVEREAADVEPRARSGVGAVRARRQVDDVVLVAIDVDDAVDRSTGDRLRSGGGTRSTAACTSMRLAIRNGRSSWPSAARRTSVSVMRRVTAL